MVPDYHWFHLTSMVNLVMLCSIHLLRMYLGAGWPRDSHIMIARLVFFPGCTLLLCSIFGQGETSYFYVWEYHLGEMSVLSSNLSWTLTVPIIDSRIKRLTYMDVWKYEIYSSCCSEQVILFVHCVNSWGIMFNTQNEFHITAHACIILYVLS